MTRTTQLTPSQTARFFGVHRRTIDRHVRAGRLKRNLEAGTFSLHEVEMLRDARYELTREHLIRQFLDTLPVHQDTSLDFEGLPF